MLDLKSEYALYGDELRTSVRGVLDSQQYINGPAVRRLEEALRSVAGTKEAIAVSSGTDALLVALMALGIGAGDEVIVPSFTFFATAGSVARLGAKPVFVDIDPRTFNMDVQAAARAITDRTRAIMPVHLYGQCAEMDELIALARPRAIPIVEDAAQAIGAEYKGRQACNLGLISCVSFYPTKNLGGLGEGGMVFTNDERLATVVRQLRNHGETERYVHAMVGANFRLDTMKAAMLLVKLAYWPDLTAKRQHNAARLDELLDATPVETPRRAADRTHVFHQYTILTDRRDALKAYLAERGVASAIYYPIPLHLQQCFGYLGCKAGDLPVTEQVAARVLSLPCHPMLADDDLVYMADCIGAFFRGG